MIPHSVLEKAAGFAIFTVVKAGFLLSARAGSGVVIARLPDGCTSTHSNRFGVKPWGKLMIKLGHHLVL